MFSCEFCEISKNIFFTEHLRWLLLIGANRIGFFPGLLWKHELNLRSNHCNRSLKKVFCKFHRKTPVSKSLFNWVAGQEAQTQMFSCEAYEIFKNWSLRTTSSETCFTWSVLLSYTSGSNRYRVFVS